MTENKEVFQAALPGFDQVSALVEQIGQEAADAEAEAGRHRAELAGLHLLQDSIWGEYVETVLPQRAQLWNTAISALEEFSPYGGRYGIDGGANSPTKFFRAWRLSSQKETVDGNQVELTTSAKLETVDLTEVDAFQARVAHRIVIGLANKPILSETILGVDAQGKGRKRYFPEDDLSAALDRFIEDKLGALYIYIYAKPVSLGNPNTKTILSIRALVPTAVERPGSLQHEPPTQGPPHLGCWGSGYAHIRQKLVDNDVPIQTKLDLLMRAAINDESQEEEFKALEAAIPVILNSFEESPKT